MFPDRPELVLPGRHLGGGTGGAIRLSPQQRISAPIDSRFTPLWGRQKSGDFAVSSAEKSPDFPGTDQDRDFSFNTAARVRYSSSLISPRAYRSARTARPERM